MIDGAIHDSMHMFLKQIAILVVSVAAVAYVFPPFAVFALVIACLYIWFAYDYISTSRDLRRIESITRSPVLSSFSELINGITTGGFNPVFVIHQILKSNMTHIINSSCIWLRKNVIEYVIRAS